MTAATRSRIRPLGVLLAPLRWLERSRGWRRRLLILIYLIVGVAAGLLIWVATSLNGLPDVDDPFDVAAFVEGSRVAEADDAFVLYRRAAEAFHDVPVARDWGATYPALSRGWPAARPEIRAWVAANRRALDLWREGTARPGALAEPLETVRSLEEGLQARLALLTKAAILEGARREAEGDRAAALDWYLAVLRAQRHYAIKSRLQWRNMAGFADGVLRDRLIAWALDPATDAALLRRAIAGVSEVDAATPPISDNLKAEYVAVTRALGDLPRLARRLDALGDGNYAYAEMGRWHHAYWFAKREPERSRRVARLLFANWLAHCDAPPVGRPKIVPNSPRNPIWGAYEPRPDAPGAARAMEPGALLAWLESTTMLWRFMPMYPYNMPDVTRERLGRGTLLVFLAEQAYRRDHAGRDAPSVEALAPEYLKAIPEEYIGMTPQARAAGPAPR